MHQQQVYMFEYSILSILVKMESLFYYRSYIHSVLVELNKYKYEMLLMVIDDLHIEWSLFWNAHRKEYDHLDWREFYWETKIPQWEFEQEDRLWSLQRSIRLMITDHDLSLTLWTDDQLVEIYKNEQMKQVEWSILLIKTRTISDLLGHVVGNEMIWSSWLDVDRLVLFIVERWALLGPMIFIMKLPISSGWKVVATR